MKVILTAAVSANGMIATKDGSEDFLPHANWIQFISLARKTGNFIWGRKTYETVTKWGDDYFKDLKGVKKIIISKKNLNLKEGFELAHSPEEAIKILENYGYKEAVVAGGSTIYTEFVKKELADEIIFDLNPSILGSGIPVFQSSLFELSLELINSQEFPDGILELHYRVK